MTEREAKSNIFKYLYRSYKDADGGILIPYESIASSVKTSVAQVARVCQDLSHEGYISKGEDKDGGYVKGASSKLFTFVEDNHLNFDGYTSDDIEDIDHKIDTKQGGGAFSKDFNNGFDNGQKHSDLFLATNINKPIKDSSVAPCFGVMPIVDSFLELIDSVNKSEMENIAMLGIFAPWGRGKTYFFEKLKELIGKRGKGAIRYDVVEFNAWKYQDTPGLWAYLFETMFERRGGFFKVWYNPLRSLWGIILAFLTIAIPIGLLLFIAIKWDNYILTGTVCLAEVFGLIEFLRTRFSSASRLVLKYCIPVRFRDQLGIQAEIEKEISRLLKRWIPNRKTDTCKVLLYVDDIDRCDDARMVGIIESLRTVLENEDIRKRLVVVCSIDPDKLKRGISHKYKDLYSAEESKLPQIVQEQMDKLFVSGIALPPLAGNQFEEYLGALSGTVNHLNPDPNESAGNIHQAYMKGKSAEKIADKDMRTVSIEDINRLVRDALIEEMNMSVSSNPITPRQIRIAYYRCIFAVNILERRGVEFDKQLIREILSQSYSTDLYYGISPLYGDVVSMVVPY